MKNRAWICWVILIGYYTAILFLPRGLFVLALLLSFLPLIVFRYFERSVHREMIDYLSYKHPEAWGRIARELELRTHGRYHPNLLSFDQEIDDPDYEKLRYQYRRVYHIQIFNLCVWTAIFLYIAVTAGHR